MEKNKLVESGEHVGRTYQIVETPKGNYRCSFQSKSKVWVNLLPRKSINEARQAMENTIEMWDSTPLT